MMPKNPKEPTPSTEPPKENKPIIQLKGDGTNGLVFKTNVLQYLVRPPAMPALVVWWDSELGWCAMVNGDLKPEGNQPARKELANKLFKLMVDLKILFGANQGHG